MDVQLFLANVTGLLAYCQLEGLIHRDQTRLIKMKESDDQFPLLKKRIEDHQTISNALWEQVLTSFAKEGHEFHE